jgi:hypothetical protein
LWLLLVSALLLPACSNDTDVLGPPAPPAQLNVVPNHHDAPVLPQSEGQGRLGRYAMAAS